MKRTHTHNRIVRPRPAPVIEYVGPYWPATRELTAREIAALMSGAEPDLSSENNWAYAAR